MLTILLYVAVWSGDAEVIDSEAAYSLALWQVCAAMG